MCEELNVSMYLVYSPHLSSQEDIPCHMIQCSDHMTT